MYYRRRYTLQGLKQRTEGQRILDTLNSRLAVGWAGRRFYLSMVEMGLNQLQVADWSGNEGVASRT